MSDRSNLCYIIDYQRNYYRTDDNNQLVMAESKEAAEVFSHEEANERINKGRKPKFYAMVSYFDCEAMHNAYSYCLELIERSVAPDAEATVTETEITGVTA